MVKYSSRHLDLVFSALCDPTRRRMLEMLARAEYTVTELAKPFKMSLPAVSKHIRVLEKAGLIRRRRDGRIHHVRLESRPMQQASAWMDQYRKFWEAQFDALTRYLEKPTTK
ncbi:MAG: metalloregulator ArsR/SmtB family transcription factor [Chthoniobacterales bacterium]